MQAKRNLSVGSLIWSEIVLTTTTHLLPGRETDPSLLWVQSFLHQVFQFLWGPSVVLSLSVEKKSWKLMQWHKHFLINTSDFRKSAANHCGEHKPSAPPPLTPERPFLVAHAGQQGACVTHKIYHWLGGLLASISSPPAPLLLSHSTPEMQPLLPHSSWRTGHITNHQQSIWIDFSCLLYKSTSSTTIK